MPTRPCRGTPERSAAATGTSAASTLRRSSARIVIFSERELVSATRSEAETSSASRVIASEDLPDPFDRRRPEHDLQRHACRADHEREDDDQEVPQQDAEREQHDPERRKGVEPRERRRDERGYRQRDHEQAEDDVARASEEEEPQPRLREPLEPPDQLHQRRQEPLALAAGELARPPPLRQPDLVAADDQLQRDQDRDQLEYVCSATGGER